jgi:hypothetical protein
VRHGISKALTDFEPDLRGALKRGGFLTRDSRVVERKKYGKAKAGARSSSPSADQVPILWRASRAAARFFAFLLWTVHPAQPDTGVEKPSMNCTRFIYSRQA